MSKPYTLVPSGRRPESFNAFEVMLAKAQNLHQAGFFEFAIIQCHITIDYFINAVLETNFMPKLNSLRDQDPNIHKLFLKAIWETDEERKYLSFTEKFGKYVSALGFDFAGYTAKGGKKLYKDLEELNALRNGIVHNRYFASDVTSAEVLKNIQLCRDVIALFLKQFNSSLDFSTLGPYTAYAYKENDLAVKVQEKGNKRVEKTTDLYYEADLTFFSREYNSVIVPDDLRGMQPEFRSFVLQVCGLDYVRYGTGNAEKSSQLGPFEPDWHNGNLFALKINLNFHEIARDFESILAQKGESIRMDCTP